MKVFQNLTIFLKDKSEEEFIVILMSNLPDAWERLLDREEYVLKMAGDKHRQYCFSTEKNPNLPDSSLWIANNEKGDLYVTNIVPKECGQLTIDEYNQILNSFVRILNKMGGFNYKLSKSDITIDDIMPSEVAQKLKSFSNAANKSTGYGHPCDFERWLDFVISLHNCECEHRGDLIRRWLHEEAGWSEHHSIKLSSQLEYTIDVLKYYDGHR